MKKLFAILLMVIAANSTAEYKENASKSKDILCMAEAVYREARGEPYIGKLAVAQVVLNRASHYLYPNSICEVVFQKYQFSWTVGFKAFLAPIDYIILAEKAIHEKHELSNFKATHFHTKYVSPNWNLQKLTSIGNHIFYKHYERSYQKRDSSWHGSRKFERGLSSSSKRAGGRI